MQKLRFVPVEEIPARKPCNARLQEFLDEFAWSNVTKAKIEWQGEYKNAASCRSCLTNAIRRYRRPMRVCMVGGEVYLEKVV